MERTHRWIDTPRLAVLLLLATVACGNAETPESAPEPAAEPAAVAAAEPTPEPGPDHSALIERANQVLGVLPEQADSETNPVTDDKALLGRLLFFDPRLSKNHDVSCNSCHNLASYGVDGQPTSEGHKGQRGDRNSPTVYNAAFHVAQFWDGRAADVEEQAMGPVTNPIEMAMPDAESVAVVLRSIPDYAPLFEAAFPDVEDPFTLEYAALAIAAFERRLVTPSRFDRFVSGDGGALRDDEIEGLVTFLDVGCVSCHMGPAVGGAIYQKLGAVKPYPTDDVGRFAVTGNEADRHVFKVPSLRNITMTGPYFHDGSIKSLDEAIRLMGEHQLGKTLDDAQVASILTFLGSLRGGVNPLYVAVPSLPGAGPTLPPRTRASRRGAPRLRQRSSRRAAPDRRSRLRQEHRRPGLREGSAASTERARRLRHRAHHAGVPGEGRVRKASPRSTCRPSRASRRSGRDHDGEHARACRGRRRNPQRRRATRRSQTRHRRGVGEGRRRQEHGGAQPGPVAPEERRDRRAAWTPTSTDPRSRCSPVCSGTPASRGEAHLPPGSGSA